MHAGKGRRAVDITHISEWIEDHIGDVEHERSASEP
jgi:hypothetical protein